MECEHALFRALVFFASFLVVAVFLVRRQRKEVEKYLDEQAKQEGGI